MSDLFRRLGSRDAKPNPDAFWSDKWGWMDEATPVDPVAVVRRGVESGTIKGEEMSVDKGGKVLNKVMLRPGDYLVIPVNGGE